VASVRKYTLSGTLLVLTQHKVQFGAPQPSLC